VQPIVSSIDWLTDGLSDLITYLMKTGQSDAFEYISELDLSMSQVRMLFLVDASPHAPALHELAAELGLSMAATGRAADGLVRVGMVTRHEDETDRRVKRIKLTPSGHDLVVRLPAARMEDLRRFAVLLSEEERTRLAEALAPILIRPEIRALTIGTPC
jgi:DNA-binding MarR family transcriptional regulator